VTAPAVEKKKRLRSVLVNGRTYTIGEGHAVDKRIVRSIGVNGSPGLLSVAVIFTNGDELSIHGFPFVADMETSAIATLVE
jgi:hypothetical protein